MGRMGSWVLVQMKENAASTRMRELEDKCTEKAVIRRCETEDREDSVEHP